VNFNVVLLGKKGRFLMETKKILVVVLVLFLSIFTGCDKTKEHNPKGPYDFLEGEIVSFTPYVPNLKKGYITEGLLSSGGATTSLGDPALTLTVQVEEEVYVMEVRKYFYFKTVQSKQTIRGLIEALKDPKRRTVRFPTRYQSKESCDLFSKFRIGVVYADSLELLEAPR